MILNSLILCAEIIAVQYCFKQGSVFGEVKISVANLFDWLFGIPASSFIQKPLWGCLPCMGGLWTILLSWNFDIHQILLNVFFLLIADYFLPEEQPE